MPKFHTKAVHVSQFVKKWVLSSISEESFEHYHQTGKSMRNHNSWNLSPGSRIINNLRNTWIKSLPLVSSLQASGKKHAAKNGNGMKKFKFDSS